MPVKQSAVRGRLKREVLDRLNRPKPVRKSSLAPETGKGGKESGRGLVPISGAKDIDYNRYLDTLDPRGDTEKSGNLRLAMAGATDARFRGFLDALYNGRYRNYSLAAIAKTFQISLREFSEFYSKSQNVLALAKVQQAIPDLIDDHIVDARTRVIPCDRCDGFGFVFLDDGLDLARVKGVLDPMECRVIETDKNGAERERIAQRQLRTCPACKGNGVSTKPGDEPARAKLLEMAGLIGGRRGPAVQINQNFGGMGMESAVERMSKVTFDIEAEPSELSEPVEGPQE